MLCIVNRGSIELYRSIDLARYIYKNCENFMRMRMLIIEIISGRIVMSCKIEPPAGAGLSLQEARSHISHMRSSRRRRSTSRSGYLRFSCYQLLFVVSGGGRPTGVVGRKLVPRPHTHITSGSLRARLTLGGCRGPPRPARQARPPQVPHYCQHCRFL